MSHGAFIFYELMLRDYRKPLKINDLTWSGMGTQEVNY